jgi:hypothetical protein
MLDVTPYEMQGNSELNISPPSCLVGVLGCPHVSNFDWTGCLAGCEERWGPGGRVTLWDPSVVLVQTQQEACGRWKSILIQHSVLTMQSVSGSRK